MRGVFFHKTNVANPDVVGLVQKISFQNKALNKLTEKTDLICFEYNQLKYCGEVIKTWDSGSRINKLFFYYVGCYRAILKEVDFSKYDFLYIKYPMSDPFFIGFLKKIKQKYPSIIIVLEVASYPYDQEKKTVKQKLILYVDRFYRRFLKNYISFTYCYTHFDKIFGIRNLSKDNNAVDTDMIKPVKLKPFTPGKLHVIGVAGISSWHGFDRVIEGLKRYYSKQRGKKEIIFYVVGEGPELQKLKNLVDKYKLQKHVKFEGKKTGGELNKIFSESHIAIGSLGLHRLGLRQGSTIKTREYCARAIPFVVSYNDIGFQNAPFFVHYIPGDESAVDVELLYEFYESVYKQRDGEIFTSIRKYAIDNLTWEDTMKPVLKAITDQKKNE